MYMSWPHRAKEGRFRNRWCTALAPVVLRESVLRGAWPFMLCMAAGIVLLCMYPQLSTVLPDSLMGPAG